MLKGFPIKKYLDKKPPSDNSFTTMQELKELNKIPMNKNFVRQKDDVEKSFCSIVDDKPLVRQLMDETVPIITKIKNHHKRPRPKKLAKKYGMNMKDIEMPSMKTPSYPSGHSAQSMLVGMALSKKFPSKKKQLMSMAKDISKSRNVAHAHYKSDSVLGEKIGKDMYNYIKDKI
tara:strand:+ start:48 stop:569 length:522 start_codon:yes stop_codon:yes gene_type:complete